MLGRGSRSVVKPSTWSTCTSSPIQAGFLRLSRAVLPWVGGLTAALLAAGFYQALFVAPADYQMGDAVRIMYVHVPSAYMAMFVYGTMAAASAVALIWKHTLADIVAKASAPIGTAFTVAALGTGMLWGEPMWGNLLGMGRTPHVGIDSAVRVPRLHGAMGRDR